MHHPVEGVFSYSSVVVDRKSGEHAERTKHSGMIVATLLGESLCRDNWLGTAANGVKGVETIQTVGLALGQTSYVDAILSLRQGRYVADDAVPLRVAGLTHALTPLVGYAETILPVSQLEGVVVAEVFRHRFLHGGGALQVVFLSIGVIADKVGHESSCLLYLLGVLL